MRVVRQAVSRCRRAGLGPRAAGSATSTEPTRAAVVKRAEAWRDGEIERGFSMALGRLATRRTPRPCWSPAATRPGELRGPAALVPWGRTASPSTLCGATATPRTASSS